MALVAGWWLDLGMWESLTEQRQQEHYADEQDAAAAAYQCDQGRGWDFGGRLSTLRTLRASLSRCTRSCSAQLHSAWRSDNRDGGMWERTRFNGPASIQSLAE